MESKGNSSALFKQRRSCVGPLTRLTQGFGGAAPVPLRRESAVPEEKLGRLSVTAFPPDFRPQRDLMRESPHANHLLPRKRRLALQCLHFPRVQRELDVLCSTISRALAQNPPESIRSGGPADRDALHQLGPADGVGVPDQPGPSGVGAHGRPFCRRGLPEKGILLHFGIDSLLLPAIRNISAVQLQGESADRGTGLFAAFADQPAPALCGGPLRTGRVAASAPHPAGALGQFSGGSAKRPVPLAVVALSASVRARQIRLSAELPADDQVQVQVAARSLGNRQRLFLWIAPRDSFQKPEKKSALG